MRDPLPERVERGRVRDDVFEMSGPCGERLHITASADADWEHISVSSPRRTPNWREMCFVKELFWTDEDCVVQYLPPHDSVSRKTLHMWRWLDGEFPMPPRITV